MIKSLNDIVAPFTVMKLCLHSYVPNNSLKEDYYLSPIIAKDEIIKK
jgi:hypothetical protein